MAPIDPADVPELLSDTVADPDLVPFSDESMAELRRLLAPYRCCGAPQICGARCQDSPLEAALALAEQQVRYARR